MMTDIMTKNIHNVINIIAIAIIIFLGVDTFYSLVEARFDKPDTEQAAPETKAEPRKKVVTPGLRDYEVINRRAIFGKGGTASFTATEMSQVESLDPTSLDVILLGTVAGGDEDARAVIEDKSKRSQDIYHIGDSIKGAVVKNIYRNKVVLRLNGKDEILVKDQEQALKGASSSPFSGLAPTMPPGGAGPGSTPTHTIMLNRTELEAALSNIQEVMTQVSIQPHMQDGVIDGLAVSGVKAGSIFRRAGLSNGDIIKGIEGMEVRGPEDLLSLYSSLRERESVSYQVVRRGRERNVLLRIR